MNRGVEGLLKTGGAESTPLKIFRNTNDVAMKIGTRVAVLKKTQR